MAKVIVEHEGKRHEFEGSYVIDFAINSIDKSPMEVDGLHCGKGNIGDLVVALGRTVGTIVDKLVDHEPAKRALIWDEFMKSLLDIKDTESEENKDVDESNI